MTSKPASRRISKALPNGNRFTAQFALPGLVPDVVRDASGIVFFDDERSAEIAAMEALMRLYDSRTIDSRSAGGYKRMKPVDLALAIDQLDTTPTYFAEIVGVSQERVMKWLDGEQDIPHSVFVLTNLLLLNDANFELAEEVTRKCQEK